MLRTALAAAEPGPPVRTHAELQTAVIGVCRELGLWWCVADPIRSRPGFADMIILGPRGARVVELKSTDGRRTRDQVLMSREAWAITSGYRLWRPADLADHTIRLDLEGIAGR